MWPKDQWQIADKLLWEAVCGSVLAMESISSEADCLEMSGTYKIP